MNHVLTQRRSFRLVCRRVLGLEDFVYLMLARCDAAGVLLGSPGFSSWRASVVQTVSVKLVNKEFPF